MISLSIDVTKITKDRLFKGEKGTYLDAVLIPTPNNQYNDYMVVESISKEERDAGLKGVIIGSGKDIGKKVNPQQFEDDPTPNNEPTDLPF